MTPENRLSLLSVIVPVYNTSKYLNQCIDSILNQQYVNIELILVDDGSTDDSLEICLRYQSRDHRVKVLTQQNQGQGAARNAGLDIARGYYITFVDSDDWISTDAYSENIRFLLNNPEIDIIQFPYLRVSENGLPVSNVCSAEQIKLVQPDVLYSYWLERSILRVYVWNKIYKMKVWKDLRFQPRIHCQDRYILTDVIEQGYVFYLNNQGRCFYRIREGQATSQSKTIRGLTSRFVADLHILENLKRHKHLYHLELEKYTNCISYLKELIRLQNPVQDGNKKVYRQEKRMLRRNAPTINEILNARASCRMKLYCMWYKIHNL